MNINSMEEFKKAGNSLVYTLMPLTQIHLHSDRSFELSPGGNIQYVYIFRRGIVYFNYCLYQFHESHMTARSANRAREVGIRKVLGTEKGSS